MGMNHDLNRRQVEWERQQAKCLRAANVRQHEDIWQGEISAINGWLTAEFAGAIGKKLPVLEGVDQIIINQKVPSAQFSFRVNRSIAERTGQPSGRQWRTEAACRLVAKMWAEHC
jgi:hypothetical protein